MSDILKLLGIKNRWGSLNPVAATIIMVASTVILSAVLYVAIIGDGYFDKQDVIKEKKTGFEYGEGTIYLFVMNNGDIIKVSYTDYISYSEGDCYQYRTRDIQ